MTQVSITLEKHLGKVDPDLREVILLFASLASAIKKAFQTERGAAGTKNMFGEDQIALDKWADKFIIENLNNCPLIASVASEERPVIVNFENTTGKFSITLDPMDGSSLIDVNLTIGTIIGIYRGSTPLVPGNKLAAGMYILYGPMTSLVYTVGNGNGVHEFVDSGNGKFELFNENIRVPNGKIMAPGGLRKNVLFYHEEFLNRLEVNGYKIRYSGSFVADVHQILHKGGIFTYPVMINAPNGKLRLLFEANPMGFIINQAGGEITTGFVDILDIVPTRIDQRVPLYIGDKVAVALIKQVINDMT